MPAQCAVASSTVATGGCSWRVNGIASSVNRDTTLASWGVIAVIAPRSQRTQSWKAAGSDQQLEACASKRVFGDTDGGVGVARSSLGVDHLDVGRRAGAKTDVGDFDHLSRLV